jgi:hypothetical protein
VSPAQGNAAVVHKLGVNTNEQQLMALPDPTPIETESGQRMTAGEAKQALQTRRARRAQVRRPPVPQNPKGQAQTVAAVAQVSRATVFRTASAPPPNNMGSAQFSPCGMSVNSQRAFTAVNGVTSGVVFTPGGSYKFSGCGFGTKRGSVQLTGGSGGGWSNTSLVIQTWTNDTITATVDNNLSNIGDQANVVVVITDGTNPQLQLQQSGHSFAAATAVVPLPSIGTYFLPGDKNRNPQVQSPGAAGASLSVSYWFNSSTQFCPANFPTDTLLLSKVPLKQGFTFDHLDVTNETKASPDDGSFEYRLLNKFGSGWGQNGDFNVTPQVLQIYEKKDLFLGGDSQCLTVYDVTVYVKGPRGLPPL